MDAARGDVRSAMLDAVMRGVESASSSSSSVRRKSGFWEGPAIGVRAWSLYCGENLGKRRRGTAIGGDASISCPTSSGTSRWTLAAMRSRKVEEKRSCCDHARCRHRPQHAPLDARRRVVSVKRPRRSDLVYSVSHPFYPSLSQALSAPFLSPLATRHGLSQDTRLCSRFFSRAKVWSQSSLFSRSSGQLFRRQDNLVTL